MGGSSTIYIFAPPPSPSPFPTFLTFHDIPCGQDFAPGPSHFRPAPTTFVDCGTIGGRYVTLLFSRNYFSSLTRCLSMDSYLWGSVGPQLFHTWHLNYRGDPIRKWGKLPMTAVTVQRRLHRDPHLLGTIERCFPATSVHSRRLMDWSNSRETGKKLCLAKSYCFINEWLLQREN